MYWVWRAHADNPIGALGGAPYKATERCAGHGGRMWPPPLGPQVEFPMGSRRAVLIVADACGHPQWGCRWSSLWGNETLYWVWQTHAATHG
eukprot:6469969-Pyramimonas_sp.AAC.1